MITNPDLWRRVAAVLSAIPSVEVRWRAPIIKNFDGAAMFSGGRSLIDIRPGLTEAQSYFVLLHEAGHLRAGSAGRDINPYMPPESLELSDLGKWAYKCQPAVIAIETEADRWRSTWEGYANRHYKGHPGATDIERRLSALLGWVPIDLEIRACEVAVKAAADLLENYIRRSHVKTG